MTVYQKDSSGVGRRVKRLFDKKPSSFVSLFILIPLLSPKGLETLFPFYKKIMALLSLVAMVFIIIDLFSRVNLNRRVLRYPAGLIFYFVAAIFVSLFSEAGMKNGLQELFFYPLVFFYVLSLSEDAMNGFMTGAAVLLFANLCLNLLVSPILFSGMLHMTFLGHVQIFSQYGLLSIYIAGSLARRESIPPLFCVGLLLVSVLSMLTVDADSARYSLIVFVAILLIGHCAPSFSKIDSRFFVFASVLTSFAVVFLTTSKLSPLTGTSVDWTFSGRLFVWQSCLDIFSVAPIFGYGVENPAITVFWNPNATSYAHNQMLQCMIDGGIFLLAAMILMLCSVASNINKFKDNRQRLLAISVFAASLFFMIFDSFTPYSYIYILFALVVRGSTGERGEYFAEV